MLLWEKICCEMIFNAQIYRSPMLSCLTSYGAEGWGSKKSRKSKRRKESTHSNNHKNKNDMPISFLLEPFWWMGFLGSYLEFHFSCSERKRQISRIEKKSYLKVQGHEKGKILCFAGGGFAITVHGFLTASYCSCYFPFPFICCYLTCLLFAVSMSLILYQHLVSLQLCKT